jgi:hypothetical protein
MKLEKIITLANRAVRLRFLAMERSLRATGCRLPLWVIPYDDHRFDLPEHSTWWEIPDLISWLLQEQAQPKMRKYQCLLVGNYHFVDTDVIFLRNPEEVLAPHSGFVASCGHWHNPGHTYTTESSRISSARTTTWQKDTFNSGQFACDQPLYAFDKLAATAARPEFIRTCLRFPFHEQPGLNLLVLHSGVGITNLTLPPFCMESTWAGDYPAEYVKYWQEPKRQPHLIHWAGLPMDVPRPINQLFYSFLTPAEKADWDAQIKIWTRQRRAQNRSLRAIARRFRRALQALAEP